MVRAEPAIGSRASRNGEYGSQKTHYNRRKRWSEKGVFARIPMGLATQEPEEKTAMIDATHLKTHRTVTSLQVEKGR
jgi:transposase